MDLYANDMNKINEDNNSEEIIAVNDTDNEMIVPEEMEIHDLEEGDRVPNMMLHDSLDYIPKEKSSLHRSHLMSSS